MLLQDQFLSLKGITTYIQSQFKRWVQRQQNSFWTATKNQDQPFTDRQANLLVQ